MKPFLKLSRGCFRFAVAAMFVLLFSAAATAQESGRYTYSADGTEVFDQQTRLAWKRCPEGMAWSQNEKICEGTAKNFTHAQALVFSGLSDYRIPNIKELASIVDIRLRSPAIYVPSFKNTPSAIFWSKTMNAGDINRAWGIDFFDGVILAVDCNQTNLVRLVRSTQ